MMHVCSLLMECYKGNTKQNKSFLCYYLFRVNCIQRFDQFWVCWEEFWIFWGILANFFRVYWYTTTPLADPDVYSGEIMQ